MTTVPTPQTWSDPTRQISYDPQGNILSETKDGTSYSYAYDALNRLISANGSTYQYDSLGNLVQSTEGGVVTSYSYNVLNQQISATKGGTTTTNTFDGRGNLVSSSDGTVYVYDATNRMTQGTNPQGDISGYAFNGLGYLTETTRNGISKSVTLDYTSPLKNILTETETGGLTYRHVYGLQEVSVNVGSEKLYVHLDRLGSTRLLTDELGALRSGTQYDAWGVAMTGTAGLPETAD
jgi:YD repeat-containing protein